jgi:hypothetical protein
MTKVGIYYAYWTNNWDADFHPFVDKAADLAVGVVRKGQKTHL